MTISQDALKENTSVWQCLGPISSGGTVFGLAISPVSEVPRIWAATGCGVFYSDDQGNTWQQNLAGLTTPLLSTIAVAHTGALFAGALGGDLFSSFDFGRTWELGLVPQELRATITAIVASPAFRKDGTVFAATDGGGLLVTRNSGKTWEESSFGLDDATVLALACSPDWENQEIMLAATLDGVYMSRNGGRAWRGTELVLDDDVVDVLAFSPAFGQDRTAFAGTEGGALYATTDGGRTWDCLHDELAEGPLNCLWVSPDLAESGRVVAGVGRSLLLSDDRGESWKPVLDLPGSLLALAGDGSVLLAGLHDAGVWRSTDGGTNWEPAVEGLAARGFARLTDAGDKVYAIGPQEGLWVSEGWGAWTSAGQLSEMLPIAGFCVTSEALFVASQQKGILRSTDGGSSWQTVHAAEGVQNVLVMAESGKGWAGDIAGRLFVSGDGGQSWTEGMSPCAGQEILSIVASPTYAQDHTLFMGSVIPGTGTKEPRVALWRSTNEGESWRQLTTQVTDARWVDIGMPNNVAADAALQAVVATGPYCLRPLRRAKDVWISTQVDPSGSNVLSVIVDGEVDQGGVLYAATGGGIFRSIDAGRTWQPFSAGLKTHSFISLMLHNDADGAALYALSLGGLVWKRLLG
jgi:photosystem II stability/assembly factor-like uncharacterized protein